VGGDQPSRGSLEEATLRLQPARTSRQDACNRTQRLRIETLLARVEDTLQACRLQRNVLQWCWSAVQQIDRQTRSSTPDSEHQEPPAQGPTKQPQWPLSHTSLLYRDDLSSLENLPSCEAIINWSSVDKDARPQHNKLSDTPNDLQQKRTKPLSLMALLSDYVNVR